MAGPRTDLGPAVSDSVTAAPFSTSTAQDRNEPNPMKTSSDYDFMIDSWRMVDDILAGVEAMRALRQGGSISGPPVPFENLRSLQRANATHGPESPYLPKFENETWVDYINRLKNAPLTNIYEDISKNLASKPFSKTCELAPGAGADLEKLQENIDGQGNKLHVFASETFKSGMDKGIDWIYIDYTKVPPGATLADERALGARPYWVHIPPERLRAVYSTFINGQEFFTHARIYEPRTEVIGFDEVCYECVRVLDRPAIVDPLTDKVIGFGPATWELWELEEKEDANGKKQRTWVITDAGDITIGIIPLVPFRTGKRHGASWKVTMPLINIARMQIEEFQQESHLKHSKEMTAHPMLKGLGVTNKNEKGEVIQVPVGPKCVLFAPMDANGNHGDWDLVEPQATSLTFLKDDLAALRTEMRDLGMQPLTAANLTVITTANVSQKAHSSIQAWALALKDALEQAWKITCLWLNQNKEPVVNIHLDFGVEVEKAPELDALEKARAGKVISKAQHFSELKRRAVLADDADFDDNQEQIAEEDAALSPEVPIDPLTGKPLNIDPLTGQPRALPPQPQKRPPPNANGGNKPPGATVQ